MGWSEQGPLPRDAVQFARELHLLLQKANIAGPYIMVGHSMGGLPVRVYTHDYSAEVAGVVLIESMVPVQTMQYPSQTNTQTINPTRQFSIMTQLARFGIVRLMTRLTGFVPTTTLEDKANFALTVRPLLIQTVEDEARGMPDSLAQAREVKTFGDIPLIVLTSVLNQKAGWQAGQVELLQLSTNSQHLMTDKSDHNIEINQPDMAVVAIVAMVDQVRK
jgi:pimeloyl-ACP methyl ester carboxylesterase